MFEQYRAMQVWLPSKIDLCPGCAGEERKDAEAWARNRVWQASRDERAIRAGAIQDLLRRAGASPWEHGHATLDNYDPTESGDEPVQAAWEFARRLMAAEEYDPVPGLYLCGLTGTGKSHLATAIAREVLLEPTMQPESVVFDPADVLVSRIRSMYGGNGDLDGFLRRREEARLWILDDLGREPPHPDVIGHLTMLISQRSKRGTVITGNLRPEQYETRHPELARIGSRLGPGYFRTVWMEGRDRRFDKGEV